MSGRLADHYSNQPPLTEGRREAGRKSNDPFDRAFFDLELIRNTFCGERDAPDSRYLLNFDNGLQLFVAKNVLC